MTAPGPSPEEAWRQHERRRDAMIAGVAHELRAPIAILQAEVEGLLDGVIAPTPEALASLHDEVLRLGRMVEDLQTVATAEAGGLTLERQAVDLAAVVEEAAGSWAARFAHAGVRLERSVASVQVWADPRRVYQVVVNLLANAAKFTPPGGTARVSVRDEGQEAVLEVADDGPGVPAEEKGHIFERFAQGAAGRRLGGAGIGLAVVKDLVEAHEGVVLLTDVPGGGACFVVRLPAARATGLSSTCCP